AYWKRALADAPRTLELPADRPRPAVASRAGGTVAASFDAGLTEGLRGLAAGERGTLFMAVGALFQVLLHRYSGQDDGLTGTPIGNRPIVEAEGLIGFFANTLVLRGRLDADPPFRRFFAAFRETALDAFDHQDLPFERLVEELRPERSGGRNPVFQ